MKKTSAALLAVLMILTLSACEEDKNTATSNADSVSSVIESSTVISTDSEIFDMTEPEDTQSAASSDTSSNNSRTEISKAAENSATGSTTKQPTQSAPPSTSSTPSTATQPPVTSPKPDDPPKSAFDVNVYVAFAEEYGKSIGLIYDEEITDGGWNAPVNLYAALSDENMKQGIRGSCERIKKENFKYFLPYAEKQGDGSYQLIIFYS